MNSSTYVARNFPFCSVQTCTAHSAGMTHFLAIFVCDKIVRCTCSDKKNLEIQESAEMCEFLYVKFSIGFQAWSEETPINIQCSSSTHWEILVFMETPKWKLQRISVVHFGEQGYTAVKNKTSSYMFEFSLKNLKTKKEKRFKCKVVGIYSCVLLQLCCPIWQVMERCRVQSYPQGKFLWCVEQSEENTAELHLAFSHAFCGS